MTLTKPAAFYLQASIVVAFLAGAAAPTPLYPAYQAAWGFSPIAVTGVFGIYAVAVLAALLTAGSLSDHLGRRPVLIAAALVQVAAMGMFVFADGLPMLLAARVVQGLSVGAAAGAVGAGLMDLDPQRGPLANALSPMIGTGLGGLVSGLMAQFLPHPTATVYAALAALFLAQAVGVWLMPKTAPRRPGALASLRPALAVPPALRRPLLLATPALVASWSLAGFYGSLGPSLVRQLTGLTGLAVGSLALTTMALGGVVTVGLLRHRPAPAVLAIGMAALLAGVGTTLVGIGAASAPIFFAGALVAGAGFGAGFQGAIRTVAPLAAPHERAGVLSVLYVVAYLAMGLPAIGAGVRVVARHGAIGSTAIEFGAFVMVLAAVALAGMRASRPVRRVEPAHGLP